METKETNNYKPTEFQLQFFKRIDIEPMPIKTLDDIAHVQKATSFAFSFENLDIITNTYETTLTRPVLIKQLLCNLQGGLCYKTNTLLADFLKEFGFDIYQIRGSVHNQETHDSWNIPSGHMINILNYENQLYVIDAAFGGMLSLKPIPVTDNGEIEIESITGIYRIRKVENIVDELFKYTHVLEFRKSDSFKIEEARNWTLGYAFDPLLKCDSKNDQSIVQGLVINDPNKEFNIRPLSFKLLSNDNHNSEYSPGLATLTYHSFTHTTFDGEKTKTKVDSFEQYNNYLDAVFKLPKIDKPFEI